MTHGWLVHHATTGSMNAIVNAHISLNVGEMN